MSSGLKLRAHEGNTVFNGGAVPSRGWCIIKETLKCQGGGVYSNNGNIIKHRGSSRWITGCSSSPTLRRRNEPLEAAIIPLLCKEILTQSGERTVNCAALSRRLRALFHRPRVRSPLMTLGRVPPPGSPVAFETSWQI